jgi:glycosyltransferase involved in cell wall biosynthesis
MAGPFRLAYVLKRYPRLSETFILNEVLELQRQGINITIVAMKDPGEAIVHDNVRALKAPIYYLPPKACIGFEKLAVRALTSFSGNTSLLGPETLRGEWSRGDYSAWLQAAMVAPLVKSLGIDHIHAHFATSATTAALALSTMTGIPFSFTAHAKDIYHESVDQKALAEKIQRARFVITVSEYNRAYLRRTYGGAAAQVQRIYNGLDLERFRYEAPWERPARIVAVGRLVEKKGFADLIEACALLAGQGRHFSCQIVGTGPLESHLRARIGQLGLQANVELVGPRSESEVMKLIQGAAVLTLPCVIGMDGDRDGLPTVLLEAMALGTPCVSTDVTGIPEVVRDGETGLMVPQHEPAALAEAIERLLGDSRLRVQLAGQARRLIEAEFDLRRNAARLRAIFHAADRDGLQAVRGVG